MIEDILQESETEIRLEKIKSHIAWWERKRLFFNIILFATGFLPFVFYNMINVFFSPFLIFVFIYAVVANLCYCAGWGIGFLIWHYTKRIEFLNRANWLFLILGLILSIGLTLLFSIIAVEEL